MGNNCIIFSKNSHGDSQFINIEDNCGEHKCLCSEWTWSKKPPKTDHKFELIHFISISDIKSF